jgi:hypothetical protein
MSSHRLPPWFLELYFAFLSDSKEMAPDVRERQAIDNHAELMFRVEGGARCSLCKSHVRHVVQVTIHKHGIVETHRCLCTRCIEGERAMADEIVFTLGKASVTLGPKQPPTYLRRWNEERTTSDAQKAVAAD